MKIKKFLSVLTALSVVMTVFTGIGTVSYAENDNGIISEQVAWGASKDSLTQKGTFNEAITAAEKNKDIKYLQLLVDIDTVPDGYSINGGEFTLDLNGHSVESDNYTISVYNGAKVTIDDTSEDKKGTVKTTTNQEYVGASALYILNAEVTVKNGNYTGGGVKNGKATNAVLAAADSKLTIDGGTFSGGTGISQESGSAVTVNGGTVAPTYYEAFHVGNGATLTITDCNITLSEIYRHVTFYGKKLDLSKYEKMPEGFSVYYRAQQADDESYTLMLPDGFKAYDFWNYVSDSYDRESQSFTGKTAEELYFYKTTVPEIVKEVEWTTSDDKTEQGPLGKAVDLANRGTAVTQIKFIADVSGYCQAIEKGDYTVDLNGHTYTYDYMGFYMYNDTSITFTDTSESKTGKIVPEDSEDYCAIYNYGGKLVINSGTYTGGYALASYNLDDAKATLEINAGTFEASVYAVIYCEGDATVKNGTFKMGEQDYPNIYCDGGKLDVSSYSIPDGFSIYIDPDVSADDIKFQSGYKIYDYYNYPSKLYPDGRYTFYSAVSTVNPEYKKEVKYGASADNLSSDAIPMGSALALAQNDDTVKYIKVQQNINGYYYEIYSGEITVDLNGYKISDYYSPFYVSRKAVLTINDTSTAKSGTVEATNDNWSGAVQAYDGGKIIINGGNYSGAYCAVDVRYDRGYGAATFEINGGTFSTTGRFTILDYGNLTVNGGTFNPGLYGIIYCYGTESSPAYASFKGGTLNGSGQYSHICYAQGLVDLSEYDKVDNIILNNDAGADVEINDSTIKLPKGYAVYNESGDEVSTLPKGYELLYTVKFKKYNAEKVTVSGAETNADAVGYYVKNVPWHDGLKWYAVTDDSKTLTTAVDFGTKISGDLDVSFGIVLHGKLGDYTTSDIESVYVSK